MIMFKFILLSICSTWWIIDNLEDFLLIRREVYFLDIRSYEYFIIEYIQK